jgi:CAAX prenyl protease-like protein
LNGTAARWGYLCVRVVGPTLVVPVMEELFFRDFLQRALVRGARFEDVPIGTFTWFSLIGMSLLFGVNHGAEWPEGIVYGLMMGVLLVRTKSLGSCIVAHAMTNWTLYLYVIYHGDWQFM